MADAPPYLPVIRTITKPDGSSMLPVDELRIMPSLVATRVVDDGPDRIELSVYTAPSPDTVPIPTQTSQHPIAAGDDQSVLIVVSADGGPVLISQLDFFPAGAVTANAVNYVTIALLETDGNGATTGISSASPTSFDTSTVSWQAGKIAFTWPGQCDLTAGHGIIASIVTEGAGVPLPSGIWRIT